jgi:hypothetical protein
MFYVIICYFLMDAWRSITEVRYSSQRQKNVCIQKFFLDRHNVYGTRFLWHATSDEREESREFPDAIPCLHGVPTSLAGLFLGVIMLLKVQISTTPSVLRATNAVIVRSTLSNRSRQWCSIMVTSLARCTSSRGSWSTL